MGGFVLIEVFAAVGSLYRYHERARMFQRIRRRTIPQARCTAAIPGLHGERWRHASTGIVAGMRVGIPCITSLAGSDALDPAPDSGLI